MAEGDLRTLALQACIACGGSPAMAASLVEATMSAERAGRRDVGIAHLLDYLDSLKAGRIDGQAEPGLERPLPGVIRVDARRGIAQLGFDRALDELVAAAATHGIALFTLRNGYTAGELGHYVRKLAEAGLVALAFANAHAMVAPSPGAARLYGTNPLAFAMPLATGGPLVIDQATSATAFVTIARAAERGEALAQGMAVDSAGRPTTDAVEAVHGALLPFGGYKGANIALMVELLAAGLAGASWSTEAGHFREGHVSPGTGLTVIAIAPQAAGDGLTTRAAHQVDFLAAHGVHVPGLRAAAAKAEGHGRVQVEEAVVASLRRHAAGKAVETRAEGDR